MMTPNGQDTIDFSVCESEILDKTGAIQSFGAVLVLEASSHKLLAASENWNSFSALKIQAKDFGQPIDLSPLCRLPEHISTSPQRIAHVEHNNFELCVHRINHQIILDYYRVLPIDDQQDIECPDFKSLNYFQGAQRLTEAVQKRFGLARVMVYAFDEEQAGDVIAESCWPAWEPYLGLHYPATDIPQVARQLYLTSGPRLISDVSSQPFQLISQNHDIDLSQSILRSVSKYHIEYLENMGVRASCSIPIIVENQLWGLIACHHPNPFSLSKAQRDTLQQWAQQLAQHIERTQQERQQKQRNAAETILTSVKSCLKQDGPPEEVLELLLLSKNSMETALAAQASAIYTEELVIHSGSIPPKAWLDDFAEMLKARPENVYASAHLAQDFREPPENSGECSGVLAYIIQRAPLTVAMSFRHQKIKEIHWGGDPRQPALQKDNKLSPRNSFGLYKEIVRGQSQKWSRLDIETLQRYGQMLSERFSSSDLISFLQTGAARLTEQIVQYAYITRVITQGLQHGALLSIVTLPQTPPSLLQINREVEQIFDLPHLSWQKGQNAIEFLKDIGLSDAQIERLNATPQVLSFWSPRQGHRNIKISRRSLFGIETKGRRHAIENFYFFDITSEERVNQALKAAKIQAESGNQSKLNFLSNTSHELKTPLHVMVGFAEILADNLQDSGDEQSLICVQHILKAGQHMKNLVEQLLLFSKSNNGHVMLPVEKFELKELIQNTLHWQHMLLNEAQITVHCDLPEANVMIEANKQSIQQILLNLLSNLIKFAPGTEAWMRLKLDDLSQSVVLELEDRGIGISEDEIHRVFEAFYQGRHPDTLVKQQGSGVGLALVKKLCEMHRGQISIQSQKEQGTTLCLVLPLKQNRARLNHDESTSGGEL